MNPAYLDSQKIYIYPGGVKTDITLDVLETITAGDWGIMGWEADDRVGNTGYVKLILDDSQGKYTPGLPTALAEWDQGVPLELELTYSGSSYLYRFYVDEIKPPRTPYDIRTEVTALDWFHYASRQPIQNPGVLANQRGNQVISKVLEIVAQKPQAVDFDEGINVFPTAFDTVTSQTKAYDEFVKVALSELGWVYMIKDRFYGETLVFKNATTRNGLHPLSVLPLAEALSGFLVRDGGGSGFLLNHTGGKIILDQIESAVFDNNMIDVQSGYGKNTVNQITIQANPRRVDSSPQVLFRLDKPIALGSGQVVQIRGNYADPAGGAPINAQNMIDPVITTDYLVNSSEDGTGADLSSSLEFVSVQYGTEGFIHEVRNTSATAGWLTKYQTRGYGIYNYNPITYVAKDGASMDEFGPSTRSIDQKYKSNLHEGAVFAEAEVFREKDPRVVLERVRFCANGSAALMTAFLNIRPGHLARFVIDKLNLDGHYWIQGMDNISISDAGVIFWEYVLREQLSLASGRLSMIALEFGGNTTVDGIFFGYLPRTANIQQRSYSFWIWRVNETDGGDCFHMGAVTDVNGMGCYGHNNTDKAGFWVKTTGTQGTWEATTPPLSPGVWHHVVWTYDKLTPTTAPKLYVDGTSRAVSQIGSLTGSVADETNVPFSLGNINTATHAYDGALSGKLKDCRVYNRILSGAEAATLYNAGVQDAAILSKESDGLIFQAICIKTEEIMDYMDDILEEDQYVIDNVYGAVGKPHGEPIARSLS